ncbi:PAC2 family protein [Citricoccus sp. GCM10030269]|uniref:PAC2 family protein n=1 Tax=Citricoccus sp. GCM10030269 TaxID=3273388 RepID=UPI00360D59D3
MESAHGPLGLRDHLARSVSGRRPVVLIAAFEGWNDAGEAATSAIELLRHQLGATAAGSLTDGDYYDYQFTRPTVTRDADGLGTLHWPQTRMYRATDVGSGDQGTGVDVLLVSGAEPSYRWQAFTAELLTHAAEQNVDAVVMLGALLADVPHTRPLPAAPSSADPEVREAVGAVRPTYEGPTGIVGVVTDTAARAGLPTVSLWATVPHYVSQAPSPKAELALLRRLEDLLQVTLDLGALAEDAEAWERGVNELAGEDPDVAAYVEQLEQARDTEELPEASGEAIAREFERYLRRRGRGRD